MMTYELDDIEKRVLLDAVVNRARADLNDGRPLTEMCENVADSTCAWMDADNVLSSGKHQWNNGHCATCGTRQPRQHMTEEQKELLVDASTLSYMAIRFSGLYKQLSGKEWDEMADVMGEKVVEYLNGLVDAEMVRRETGKG